MAAITVENLSFAYEEHTVLQHVSFTLQEGQFVALCGQTGSGKSTLLRLLKKELQPVGQLAGHIQILGETLDEVAPTTVGFVMQKPEEQLVMEKVWQELAYPLENLAVPPAIMEQQIAEVMHFLGIHHLFDARTDTLSGGQKQLVNLAAVLVTKPKILLLDEPTAQLDPLAATRFIQLLARLHQELGMTICIIEHRLEELLPYLDEILLLEKQTIQHQLPPRQLIETLTNHTMLRAFGAGPYIYSKAKLGSIPLTINEARIHLPKRETTYLAENSSVNESLVFTAKELYFRYEKRAPDLLKGISLSLHKGDCLAILGGNGTGKTTLLYVLAGLLKPYKGKTNTTDRIAVLPQNPLTTFTKNTVLQELESVEKVATAHFKDRFAFIEAHFQLQTLYEQHPFDLSGGQQQLLAFAKLYCLDCPIVLLDEPTKGLDTYYKGLIQQAMQQLRQEGTSIITVTHDLDFAAEVASHCTMLFQGKLTSLLPMRQFFTANEYYTTSTRRITANISNTITADEAVSILTT